jgi:hypothetical protein
MSIRQFSLTFEPLGHSIPMRVRVGKWKVQQFAYNNGKRVQIFAYFDPGMGQMAPNRLNSKGKEPKNERNVL